MFQGLYYSLLLPNLLCSFYNIPFIHAGGTGISFNLDQLVLALTALIDRARTRREDSILDSTPEEDCLLEEEAGEAEQAAIDSALDDLDRDTAILEERRRNGLAEDAHTTARIQRQAVAIQQRVDLRQAQSDADDAAEALLQNLDPLLKQFCDGDAAAFCTENTAQHSALSSVIVWGHLWMRRECRVDQLRHAFQKLVELLPAPSLACPGWMTLVRDLAAQTLDMVPLLARLTKLEVLVGARGEEAQLLQDVTGKCTYCNLSSI